MNRYIGWMLLMAFFLGIHLSAGQAITMTARPAVIPAKGSARLKVIVERNAMNRTLMWEVDGREYYRSSTISLEGTSAPRSYSFMVRDLPAGHFDVRARVLRSDNTEALAETCIIVGGGDGLNESAHH